jgi:type I restriction-modification system DNA methylase subunit
MKATLAMQPENPGEDLVSITEIAGLAGVKLPTVSNWIKRYPAEFPKPAGKAKRGPSFRRSEILNWLNATGRMPDSGAQQALPAEIAAEADASALLDAQAESIWWGFVSHCRGLMPTADALLLLLTVLSGKPAETRRGSTFSVPEDVLALCKELSATQRAALATRLVERLTSGDYRGGEFNTPPQVAELIAGLLGPRQSVFDPATGIGTLLNACGKNDPTAELSGQELNETTTACARLYLELMGSQAEIRMGDSITDDRFAGQQFAAIASTPPLGVRLSVGAITGADPRWAVVVPSQNADEAWIQHVLYHLAPGGRAVLQVATRVLSFSGNAAKLRSALVRSGNIRAVIQLPAGAVLGTAAASALLVLEQPKELVTNPRVLLANPALEPLTHKSGRSQKWEAAKIAQIISTVTNWLANPTSGSALSSEYAELTLQELDEADFDLTPRRYLAPAVIATRHPQQIRSEINSSVHQIDGETEVLRAACAQIAALAPTAPTPTPRRPLASLLQQELRRTPKIHQLLDSGQIAVHTPNSLASGTEPKRFISQAALHDRHNQTPLQAYPGDVLLVADGPVGQVYLVAEPMVVSSHFIIIPTAGTDLDERYLAFWLSGQEAQAQLERMTQGTTLRRVALKDVRQLEVPVPARQTQQQIGELYEQVQKLKSTAANIRTAITQLEDLALEAAGAAVPPQESPAGIV